MVGTIEPRLVAPNPFNDSSRETYTRLDLRPLQHSDGLLPLSRSLTLEPLAPLNNQQSSLVVIQAFDSFDGETAMNQYGFGLNGFGNLPQVLQRPPARITSSQSLRKILADEAEPTTTTISSTTPTTTTPRKRQRKDEFVKLPQPEKKQKGAQQVVQPLVPPIIVGIHEPPPNQASKFRPINPGGPFRDLHGRNTLNTAANETGGPQKQHIQPCALPNDSQVNAEPVSAPQPADEQPAESIVKTGQARNKQARNKWTEEETRQLLLGVQKHGIGNWKRILEDSEFIFNNRKAVHIKDRFRTCFPNGYEGNGGRPGSSGGKKPTTTIETKGEIVSRSESDSKKSPKLPTRAIVRSATDLSPPKKGRSHRKDLSDLTELGIVQPFLKSNRRQRRAFTEEEDRNILLGFEKHGQSNWTAIQRDSALGLDSRKPTDIRDRFRNRYPDKHKEITGDDSIGKDEPLQASLRTKVSHEELLDPSAVAPPSQPQPQIQFQAQYPNQPMQDPHLPPISSQFSSDLLSNSRLPRMMTFTELLGPIPAMDPCTFPDWTDTTPFGDFFLPEIQTVQQGVGMSGMGNVIGGTGGMGSGMGAGKQNRSVYDISSICEAVEPYATNAMGG